MTKRFRVLFSASLFALGVSAVSGCASLVAQDAAGTEQLLSAAGFQKRPAASPEQIRNLEAMPPFKFVMHDMGHDVTYSYADPVRCHCLYVGGLKEYGEYQRLARQRDVAEGELWAEDDVNWSLWGLR
jgi:hypothetical protein